MNLFGNFLFTLMNNWCFVVIVRNRFELELDFELEVESRMVVIVEGWVNHALNLHLNFV
jgi:hypothetical protein